jgi:two-component system LytT family response regulator
MTERPSRVRVAIVDDEPPARGRMRTALSRMADVEIVAECGDGVEAVEIIRDRHPDLVLLDVQMPGLDGFGVVDRVGPAAMPAVVFVTAYDRFALKAFEVHALDYVLKPFDRGRLQESVIRAVEHIRMRRVGELGARLAALLADLPPLPAIRGTPRTPALGAAGSYASRILVREGEGLGFVETERVDWLEPAGNYVRLHVGAKAHLVRATLSGILQSLDPARFVRIHRSAIVNLDRIREIQPWVGGDYLAILKDGRQLRVSRNFRDDLLKPLT